VLVPFRRRCGWRLSVSRMILRAVIHIPGSIRVISVTFPA
jgi:hypothetical protein